MSIITLLTYGSDCAKHSKKCKCSPHLRLKGRGNTIVTRPMLFHWYQVKLVLVKADTYKGRRKVKDQWEEEPCEVECQIAKGVP